MNLKYDKNYLNNCNECDTVLNSIEDVTDENDYFTGVFGVCFEDIDMDTVNYYYNGYGVHRIESDGSKTLLCKAIDGFKAIIVDDCNYMPIFEISIGGCLGHLLIGYEDDIIQVMYNHGLIISIEAGKEVFGMLKFYNQDKFLKASSEEYNLYLKEFVNCKKQIEGVAVDE